MVKSKKEMWHKWHKFFVHIIFAPNVTLEALAQFWKKTHLCVRGTNFGKCSNWHITYLAIGFLKNKSIHPKSGLSNAKFETPNHGFTHYTKWNDGLSVNGKKQNNFLFLFSINKFLLFSISGMNVEEKIVEKLQRQSREKLQKLREEM